MDYEHLEYHRQRARELVDRAEKENFLRQQRKQRNVQKTGLRAMTYHIDSKSYIVLVATN